jgi:hypothetical protein
MSGAFEVPTTIEETVREIHGLKAATKTAINGTRLLGPHIANQVAALLTLAGEDETAAEAISDTIWQSASKIAEHLQSISLELAAVGAKVAYAYEKNEENNAKRKTTAAKAGVRASSTAASKNLSV